MEKEKEKNIISKRSLYCWIKTVPEKIDEEYMNNYQMSHFKKFLKHGKIN